MKAKAIVQNLLAAAVIVSFSGCDWEDIRILGPRDLKAREERLANQNELATNRLADGLKLDNEDVVKDEAPTPSPSPSPSPTPPLSQFFLSVENGSGEGSYTAGQIIQLVARNPVDREIFDRWESIPAGLAQSPNLSTTLLTMPASNALARAFFINGFYVTVNEGSGGDLYREGQTVQISTTDRPGFKFENWTSSPSITIVNATQQNTTITVPNFDIEITANYAPASTIVIIDQDGNQIIPSDTYFHGSEVTITAPTISGLSFDRWDSGGNLDLDDETSPSITFLMPQSNLSLTAFYSE